MVPCPEHARKRLYKHGGSAAKLCGVILVGYCPDTLEYFTAMFEEAQKTFPNLKAGDVTCAKVLESSNVKGFTVILFDVDPTDAEFATEWDRWDCCLDFRY